MSFKDGRIKSTLFTQLSVR